MAPGIPRRITISRGRLYYYRQIGTMLLIDLTEYANGIGRKCNYSDSMIVFEG